MIGYPLECEKLSIISKCLPVVVVVVVLVGGEEGQVVAGVAVDRVEAGQQVPQPQRDRVRAQHQGTHRLRDGVRQDKFQGMHVARGCEIVYVTLIVLALL